MKNNLFTLIFASILFSCLPGVAFPEVDSLFVTELKVFDRDSTYRYLYLYDGQGNKVLETKYKQENTDWVRVSLNEWIYEGNNCVIHRERKWRNDEWDITYVSDYEYLDQLKISEIQTVYTNKVAYPLRKISYEYVQSKLSSKKEYDWLNGLWTLMLKNDFTYFVDGKLETQMTDVYQSEVILKQFLSIFSYNDNGTLSNQLLKKKENNTDWVNSELIYWYYKPGSEQIISQKNKKWIAETLSWENVQRIDYDFSESNILLSETYQRWESMFWRDDCRYEYEYGTDNNLQKKILFLPLYHQWRSNVSIHYMDYTGTKARLLESKFDFWGGNAGELVNSYIPFLFNNEPVIQRAKRIEINYLPVDPTGIPTLEKVSQLDLIAVYPNPSEGVFYFNTQVYKVLSWNVSDMNGHILKNQIQSMRSGLIDLTDLPKGIYFLSVNTDQGKLFQKLLKY